MRRIRPILALVLVLAATWAVAWIAWPFWTAHRIARAVEEQDTLALTPLVDWAELRDGLKDDLTQRARNEIAQAGQGGAIGSGLGDLLAPTLIELAVNNLVTPEGITELARLGRSGSQLLRDASRRSGADGGSDAQGDARDRKFSLGHAWFTSPTRFRFDLLRTGKDRKDEPGPTLVLAFRNFRWQLVRLRLP